MDTTLARKGVYERSSWRFARRVATVLAVIASVAIAIGITAALLPQPQAETMPTQHGALSAQQLVIQSEVHDRYRPAGLTPEQVVIRGEVRDRYAPAAGGLSAQQLVIRSEVADRYRDR